jgi:hypothetical protein
MYWGQFEMFSLGLASKLGWQPVTIAHLIPCSSSLLIYQNSHLNLHTIRTSVLSCNRMLE